MLSSLRPLSVPCHNLPASSISVLKHSRVFSSADHNHSLGARLESALRAGHDARCAVDGSRVARAGAKVARGTFVCNTHVHVCTVPIPIILAGRDAVVSVPRRRIFAMGARAANLRRCGRANGAFGCPAFARRRVALL